MGWLWGKKDASSASNELDPSLREFLKKKTPTDLKPPLPLISTQEPNKQHAQARSQLDADPTLIPLAVPPESRFQDGRYAHLWKNYTPYDILVSQGKTEQDRLRDIVDSFNDRKASIGRVAMENCALEYMEQFECFRHPPSWFSAGTLCNAESRKFNRCYDVQSKFLKALGYMTMDPRTAEDYERIQMHADKLYQQMLTQEKQVEEAKKQGRPPPQFESLLSEGNIAKTWKSVPWIQSQSPERKTILDDEEIWKQIKPESRIAHEKKVATLGPDEQDLERMAMLGELRATTRMSEQVEETLVEERINRLKRREAGKATIGDTIKHWWGWG